MLRTMTVCIALALSLGVSAARAEAPVSAEDVTRAEAFASDAFDAYTRGDYAGAVTLYRKALNAAPSADIVYNLARIYDVKLKDRALAIEYYERYGRDTGADPERVRTANERLARLRELEKVASEPARTEASAALAAEPRGAPPQPIPALTNAAEREGGLSGWQVSGVLTGALGIVGIGVGTAFGLMAKSDADTANAACDGNACRTQQGIDAARAADRAATVSTVAFVAGGALTLVGVALLVFGGGSNASVEPMRSSAQLEPYAGPDAWGARVRGRW